MSPTEPSTETLRAADRLHLAAEHLARRVRGEDAGLLAVFLTGRPLPTPRIGFRWTYVLLAVVVVYWILRNIPVHPFTLLAPH